MISTKKIQSKLQEQLRNLAHIGDVRVYNLRLYLAQARDELVDWYLARASHASPIERVLGIGGSADTSISAPRPPRLRHLGISFKALHPCHIQTLRMPC